jgi:hypothetical protein
MSPLTSAAEKEKKAHGNATKHGLVALKRVVNGIGNRVIDRRTVTGRALARWRKDLIQDIGGDPSTQELALIELCVKSKLLLDSCDAWLLTQPSSAIASSSVSVAQGLPHP